MAIQFEVAPAERAATKKKGGINWQMSLGAGTPGATDRMFFTEQLALLLETGESIVGALNAIVEQTENPAMRKIVARIAQDIGEGKSFAYALTQHDTVFSSTYVNLIAASEHGGFMHEVLEQLLDMDQKREELRATLVSAATYPLFLIFFSIAVVVFVLVVVFPKFGSMFTSIYDQLPATTRGLMTVSDLLRAHWMVILGGLGAFLVAVRHWLHSESGQARVDRFKIFMPGLRGIFLQIYLVQALQVMSLSLKNGVSVMESLEACRDVVRNSLFRDLIREVELKVQEGGGIAAGFANADFIPQLAKHMITTGEQTGNVGKVMGRVALYYEAQLKKKLEAVSKLAEPIMLLVMGVIVGILVSSLILPIFKLSRAVS